MHLDFCESFEIVYKFQCMQTFVEYIWIADWKFCRPWNTGIFIVTSLTIYLPIIIACIINTPLYTVLGLKRLETSLELREYLTPYPILCSVWLLGYVRAKLQCKSKNTCVEHQCYWSNLNCPCPLPLLLVFPSLVPPTRGYLLSQASY